MFNLQSKKKICLKKRKHFIATKVTNCTQKLLSHLNAVIQCKKKKTKKKPHNQDKILAQSISSRVRIQKMNAHLKVHSQEQHLS